MSEWQDVRLRDICDSIDYGLTASATDETVGPKFLRITDIVRGQINWDTVPFVDATPEQAHKYQLCSGDIVIARTGATTGYSAWIAEPPDSIFASYLIRLKISDTASSRFVGYLLKSEQFWGYVRGVLGDKSAQPNASATTLTNALLRIPSNKGVQGAIAQVLRAFDDKIAVNDRVAGSSLELALAGYEAAVLRGRFARIVSMAASAQWLSGGTPNTSENAYWGGDIPWISALSLKSPWIDDSDRKVTDLGAKSGTRLVPKDTVLFVVRGSSLDTEFRIGLTQREVAFGQDCKALQPTNGIDPYILFLAIKSRTPEILRLVDHAGHGAGRLATDLLANVPLNLPEPHVSAEAGAELRPLVEVGAARRAENRKLREMRDTLLPKLMSGEIRVRDAEKVAEDVT